MVDAMMGSEIRDQWKGLGVRHKPASGERLSKSVKGVPTSPHILIQNYITTGLSFWLRYDMQGFSPFRKTQIIE